MVGEDSGGGGHSDKEDIWLYGALGREARHRTKLIYWSLPGEIFYTKTYVIEDVQIQDKEQKELK